MPRDKVLFFGLGAVGSVLLVCLAELAERDGSALRFVVFTRDREQARDALFHAERLFARIDFEELDDFGAVFARDPRYAAHLEDALAVINTAHPDLNEPLLDLAEAISAHAVDLASNMYDDETQRTLTFAQYRHDAALRARGVAAFINLGISPGVTNFLVGGRLHEIRAAARRDLTIERVDLYLLEDIDSDEIVFSWSPLIALEELAQRPRVLQGGRLVVLEPFSSPRSYLFPHEHRPTRQYPLYQEELLSFHRAFPEIEGLGVWSGGSEVELARVLPKHRVDAVRRDLVAWDIDLFDSVRDASSP